MLKKTLVKVNVFILKKNIKLFVGLIIGILIAGTTVYATTYLFESEDVNYDNTSSELESNNVQDAIG